MRFLSQLAVAALLAAPLPAFACSVAPGYRVPTNLELVERADLILLGTVTDGDFAPDSTDEQMISVEPVAALKGAMPTGPIALPAMIAPAAEMQLSNPYELKDAHPQSLAGACVRYVFPRGSRVLFFLDRQDGRWQRSRAVRSAAGPKMCSPTTRPGSRPCASTSTWPNLPEEERPPRSARAATNSANSATIRSRNCSPPISTASLRAQCAAARGIAARRQRNRGRRNRPDPLPPISDEDATRRGPLNLKLVG
jgi:hypothetical protein